MDVVAGGAQLGHRASDERAPAITAARGIEGEGVVLAEVLRVGVDPGAAGWRGGDRDAAVDREREREAVVVVGVLADQVHATRPARLDGRHAASLARITRTASSLSSIST